MMKIRNIFFAALTVALMLTVQATQAGNNGKGKQILNGSVQSNGAALAGYEVTLYARYLAPKNKSEIVGQTTSAADGSFTIEYQVSGGQSMKHAPVMFIMAQSGSSMLVSAIGQGKVRGPFVVNEITTVASSFAFAQFVDGSEVNGNTWGMVNAIQMAANMANPFSGDLAKRLLSSPNGGETSAMPTFNSLANVVANCTVADAGCQALFSATTPVGEMPPANVMQAVANIAKYPWLNTDTIYNLSLVQSGYGPALTAPPDAWTLFLKFTGSYSSEQNELNLMNGPGNFAIDDRGTMWVANNYKPERPEVMACAGVRVLRFLPWGERYPGSPYFDGGSSGAGFGVSIDPSGRIWVSNFGFAGVGCPAAPSDSVSLYSTNGHAKSPDDNGYTNGNMSWPQGIFPDLDGNMWIANCASDSVTFYPKGRRNKAKNLPIPSNDGDQVKPFSIGIDAHGNAWVTGSHNSSVTIISPELEVLETKEQDSGLTRPMGVVSDSKGNMWISNSDWMDMACPPSSTPDLGTGENPSVAMFMNDADRKPHPGSPFTGGGVTLPWGIAVDGNDTVWVANFGFPFDTGNPDATAPWDDLNRVSHFCGADPSKCPPGKQTVGGAISPDVSGYSSDALVRNTGIAIDLSGNVWLPNNWKQIPIQSNPGANAIVVMVGAAKPIQTPLIGPVKGFD